LHKLLNTQHNGLGYGQHMNYKHNIHNKNQTSTMKLILPSHTNALHTAHGIDGLYLERNAALV